MALHAKLQLSAPALKGPIVACRSPPLRLTDRPGRGGDILPHLPHLPLSPLLPSLQPSLLLSSILRSFRAAALLQSDTWIGLRVTPLRSSPVRGGRGGRGRGPQLFQVVPGTSRRRHGLFANGRRHLQRERERTDVFIGRGLIKVVCESLLFFSPGHVSMNLHIPF